MVEGEKGERMLSGSSGTLASQIMDKLLQLEASKTMSEQGEASWWRWREKQTHEGTSSVIGEAPAEEA